MKDIQILLERKLSKKESGKKEKLVKRFKEKDVSKGFKKRYGKDAKSVMYATATKMAKESIILKEQDDDFSMTLDTFYINLNDMKDQLDSLEIQKLDLDTELLDSISYKIDELLDEVKQLSDNYSKGSLTKDKTQPTTEV